ncbi:PRDM9 [Pelobates cultripes]|uniref:PRDM9, partial n=1 Tax=Pelobates cultripes TaxID=61616 RepID=A0AAD1R8M6_PELCU|nr:PRDM9 [Pelobates cultripes]
MWSRCIWFMYPASNYIQGIATICHYLPKNGGKNGGNKPPARTGIYHHARPGPPTHKIFTGPSTPSTSSKPDHTHKSARSGIACSRLRVLSPQPPSGHAHLRHVRRLTSSRPDGDIVNQEITAEKERSLKAGGNDYQDLPEKNIHEDICAEVSSSRYKTENNHSPHYSSDDILEDNKITSDYQMEREDEIFPLRCKQEEDSTEISTGLSITWESHPEQNDLCLSAPECGVSDHDITQNLSESDSISDQLSSDTMSNPVNILEKDLNLTDFAKESVWTANSPLATDLCSKENSDMQKNPESLSVTMYKCRECEKSFQNELDLIYHQGTHCTELIYACTECQETFNDHSDLLDHQTVHTGKKLFVCFECGKSYTQSANLLVHLRFHTREKPFSCSDCGKCFTHKSTLVKHQRIHTGTFACSDCGKCFSQNSNLVVHQRSHTGQKPYACSDCGKCFSKNSNLVIHQRIHTGEKPFVCSHCGKSFTQCSNLLTHQRIHTGERPYICSECGKCFAQIPHLIKHQKSHK